MEYIKVKDLFDFKRGTLYYKDMTTKAPCVPFVCSSATNNGIISYVDKIEEKYLCKKGTLSLSLRGSIMSSFLQEEDYYLALDTICLLHKNYLSKLQLLYYSCVFKLNAFRYCFSRQANYSFLDLKIPSPKSIPNFVITTDLVSSFPVPKTNAIIDYQLEVKKWETFKITDLFTVSFCSPTYKNIIKQKQKGKYPYITESRYFNGVQGFYDFFTEEGNAITFAIKTSQKAFYQKLPFSSGTLLKLVPKFKLDEYIALFIITVLNFSSVNFSFGYSCCFSRLIKREIKLPVTCGKTKEIDFSFMESYIKSIYF